MKTILVPVDFSQNAAAALGAASLIARLTGAKIYLLHAYIPYVPTEIHVPVSMDVYSDIEVSLKSSLENYLSELQAGGLEAEAIWTDGPVLKAVTEYSERLDADLVVIGRTGKGGFLDKLFGSVATDIVKGLEHVPVLTIPPDSELTQVGKIVYATQLEDDEEEAIEKVVSISRALGARLQFLKLNSRIQPDIQPDHQFVEPLKTRFGFTNDDFVVIDAGRNSIVSEIEQQAVNLGADILVVSAREKGFIEELLVDPSISKKLVLNTKMPLLTCRLTGYDYS